MSLTIFEPNKTVLCVPRVPLCLRFGYLLLQCQFKQRITDSVPQCASTQNKTKRQRTSEQAVVGLAPGVAVLAGQDAHGLLVRLPWLGADAEQLRMDLALCQRCAVTVIHIQLEELQKTQCSVSWVPLQQFCNFPLGIIPKVNSTVPFIRNSIVVTFGKESLPGVIHLRQLENLSFVFVLLNSFTGTNCIVIRFEERKTSV